MERKKLYKAKKNWVIGLATGLAIMALGTNIAYADNNTSNEPIVTTQQANASTQQTTNQQEQVNVQPENTIGMSSNVASNPIGSYNKDNVGYANPNSEEQYYDALQENAHHLSHHRSYNYPEKLLDKFARKDDMLKKYGVPNVYEYSNGSENPYKNVKIKQITTIPSVDADKIHYYNNGVSNAIHFYDTQGEPNYEQINKLSQALSYADYELLTDYYSQHKNTDLYGRFYDGDKVIVTPKDVLSTQDLNALYKAAYKNRPIITFDGLVSGHHITSFLQSSIESFDDGWNLTFDNGWRGYTFMDGRQIAFVETNKTRGILRNKGKNFSWKNTVLKYFAESLAYKNSVAEEVDQNTPYMLVGRNYIPVTDILTSRKSNRLENPFNISPTEIVFADKGVYAIINGAMGGYNPILVQVPMAFLKSEYRNSAQPAFDVHKNDQKYIIDKILDEMVGDEINDRITANMIGVPNGMINDIKEKIKKDIKSKYQNELMKAADYVMDSVTNWNDSFDKIWPGLEGLYSNLTKATVDSFNSVMQEYPDLNKDIKKHISNISANQDKFLKKHHMQDYSPVTSTAANGGDPGAVEAGITFASNMRTKDNWQDLADEIEEFPGLNLVSAGIDGTIGVSDLLSNLNLPDKSLNEQTNMKSFKDARQNDLDGYEDIIKGLKVPVSGLVKDAKVAIAATKLTHKLNEMKVMKKLGHVKEKLNEVKNSPQGKLYSHFDVVFGSIMAAFTAGFGLLAFNFFNKKRLAAKYAVKLTDDPWNTKFKQPSKQESARNDASSIGNSINGGHSGGDTKGSK